MCGICGVFEYRHGGSVHRELLQAMNDTLVHRGPDAEGYLRDAGVGLAMRRLSIIDRAGGQQPIPNEDETIWIVMNGEIYNFQALQRSLADRGHRLRTRSDTEVIVHLYEEYGDDCVNHLDGMFAFALYDRRPSPRGPRLLLARDRLGKKPLYYADAEGALVFGSEIKPILKDPRVGKDLDLEALHHYLSLLMVPAPLSIFRAVRKLPAGHLLVCDREGPRLRRYWNYLEHFDARHIPLPEAVAEVRRLLFAAVEKRLIAEVPLGAFLSGGLDSSVVVGIMSHLKREPVTTFSMGFDGPATHNELPSARAVAQHFRTDHHELFVRPDIVTLLPELVRYADEPFAISSAIPTFLLARAARECVTVVLTGDGGDELFGGYEHYLFERWARAYRFLPAGTDELLVGSARLLNSRLDGVVGRMRSRTTRFVANCRRPVGERRLGWASGFDELDKAALGSATARAAMPTTTGQFVEHRLADSVRPLAPEAQVNAMDTLVWLPDEMLTKVDRMTMAASIEARCPLLDWRLTEFVGGLSFAQKVPGWGRENLKHLLRRAVGDLLPPNLVKPKWGFNVPLDLWFRGGARSYLESRLDAERVRRRGVFDEHAVGRLLARHQSGEVNASNRLYALLVFDIWADAML